MSANKQIQSFDSPPSLKAGDTIGIISTARKISREEISPAIQLIESRGYKVILGKNLFGEENQFSGTDVQRASDLQDMFADKKVKAILCARGGYGTVQLLPLLDEKVIAQNPKWIIGYSDVTVLHSYLHKQFNMQTLHATMPINFSSYKENDLPIKSLFSVLEGKPVEYKLKSCSENRSGEAEGVLVGGNLSILYSLRGTLADIDTDEKILFIEDLDEYLYHIDRMMMNLKIGGKLNHLKALIVGGMSDMNDNDVPYGKTAKEIIQDSVKEFDYPVLFGFPSGHIHDNYALPFGRTVKLNVEKEVSQLSFQ